MVRFEYGRLWQKSRLPLAFRHCSTYHSQRPLHIKGHYYFLFSYTRLEAQSIIIPPPPPPTPIEVNGEQSTLHL